MINKERVAIEAGWQTEQKKKAPFTTTRRTDAALDELWPSKHCSGAVLGHLVHESSLPLPYVGRLSSVAAASAAHAV
jgi:hypothetical protein